MVGDDISKVTVVHLFIMECTIIGVGFLSFWQSLALWGIGGYKLLLISETRKDGSYLGL